MLLKFKEIFKNSIRFCGSKCMICGCDIHSAKHQDICPICEEKIKFISGLTCKKCGANLIDGRCPTCQNKRFLFDANKSALNKNNFVSALLKSIKYGKNERVENFFAKTLDNTIKRSGFYFDFIVPIPMQKKNDIKREFNHVETLIHKLDYEEKHITDLLIKNPSVSPQHFLEYEQRTDNIVGAFSVNENYVDVIKDKSILIIDDIFTTGATLNEATKVILDAGARNVNCITLLHTSLKKR